jgi:hypothetical protein
MAEPSPLLGHKAETRVSHTFLAPPGPHIPMGDFGGSTEPNRADHPRVTGRAPKVDK